MSRIVFFFELNWNFFTFNPYKVEEIIEIFLEGAERILYRAKQDFYSTSFKNWLNRDPGDKMDPSIFDIKQLGNSSTYMVLYTLEDNKIGNAQLVKGEVFSSNG